MANARVHFPGAKVCPSEASRRGVVYQGPGNETIPNRGEFLEKVMTREGAIVGTTRQDAEVRKPLMAVSACADRGNMTIFDNSESCILLANSDEIKEIRKLVKQASQKVAVERTGGTYSLRMWRMPGDQPGVDSASPGFTGLGKK